MNFGAYDKKLLRTIRGALLLTVAVGAFVFERAIQSTMNAVDEAAARTRALAAAHGLRVTGYRHGPAGPPPPQAGPGALIGMETRIVKLRHGELHVEPDRTLYDTFASYGVFFGLVEVVSVVAAWWLARPSRRKRSRRWQP